MFQIITYFRSVFHRSVVLSAFLCVCTLIAYNQDKTRAENVSGVGDKEQSKIYKGSYALIIGASKYQNNAWKELPGVIDDTIAVEAALKAQNFEVTKVLDPTSEQLYSTYRTFINKYGQDQDNRLIFYYAGHGHTLKTNYGSEMGYIVPIDAPSAKNETDFKSVALPMEQIEIFAKQVNARHALFIFDACFAGSIFDTGIDRASAESIDWTRVSKPVRYFLTSGTSGETVPDKSKFREEFVTAIGGNADLNLDGYITGREIGTYISKAFSSSKNSTSPQSGAISNRYLNQGDFLFFTPNATHVTKRAAAAGEAEYQMPPALLQAIGLYSGINGQTDKARARQLFIDASSAGDVLATMWIARHYSMGSCNFLQSQDNAEKIAKTVFSFVKEIAEKGNTEAMFLLGDAYYNGLGTEKDFSQAVIWLRKSIAKGNPLAMNELGVMYNYGEGVPKDYTQALSLYRLSAEKGVTNALSNIGSMYKDGEGVERDYSQALEFYNRAAQKGGMLGMYGLGNLYLNGWGTKKDVDKAVTWYTKAAENGHAYSLLVLARLYRDGKDVARDMTQAVKWYEKSAETGDTAALRGTLIPLPQRRRGNDKRCFTGRSVL